MTQSVAIIVKNQETTTVPGRVVDCVVNVHFNLVINMTRKSQSSAILEISTPDRHLRPP